MRITVKFSPAPERTSAVRLAKHAADASKSWLVRFRADDLERID
jgi:hypothetical protein